MDLLKDFFKNNSINWNIKHCFDSLDKIEESDLNFKEVIKRWDKLGFIDGLSDREKDLCALAFEQVATLMLFSNYEFYDKCLEGIIFPCIRRTISKVGDNYSTKKLYDSIYEVKFGKLLDEILFRGKWSEESDIECEMTVALSNALTKIMNDEVGTNELYNLVHNELFERFAIK